METQRTEVIVLGKAALGIRKKIRALRSAAMSLGLMCLASVASQAGTTVWAFNASFGNPHIQAYDLTTGNVLADFTAPNKDANRGRANGRGIAVVGNTIYYSLADTPNVYKTDVITHADLGIAFTTSLSPGINSLAWDGASFWLVASQPPSTPANDNVYQYSPSGQLLRTLVLARPANTNLARDGLEVTPGGIIANRGSVPYDIYDFNGNLQTPFFIKASFRATGIAFDGSNYIVSDTINGRLATFDGNGIFVGTVDLPRALIPFGIEDLAIVPQAANSNALRFMPLTPCRVLDTRNAAGPFGAPGLSGGLPRTIPVAASSCGIPPDARAYSANFTVVPSGPLGFLSVWPTGTPQPLVSTLNSLSGAIVSNAAIVPAGAGGALDLFASDDTEAIMDVNGYFTNASTSSSLSFFAIPPCGAADTRTNGGVIPGGTSRDFPLTGTGCDVPLAATAYSLNYTVFPQGPLGYLSTWPAGQPQPLVSTLNALDGTIKGSAAIVPAGNNSVSVFVTNATDLVIGVNGYFGAISGGSSLYTVQPCRVIDTRANQGTTGEFGPPALTGGQARNFNLPGGRCGIPSNAMAYSVNITVAPKAGLSSLAIWPAGQPQPVVSTLNAPNGGVVSNAAIVAAGTGGGVSVFATDDTDLIVDITGYFAL